MSQQGFKSGRLKTPIGEKSLAYLSKAILSFGHIYSLFLMHYKTLLQHKEKKEIMKFQK